jgi:hypothetical protein
MIAYKYRTDLKVNRVHLEIRKEISQIENGEYDRQNNPLKNAPHSQHILLQNPWVLPYPLQTAVYPNVREYK